jgi:Terminase large subunit, T4likevirus-type, N-terminal
MIRRHDWLGAMHSITFARERLNFEPDPQQVRVLDPTIHRGLLNCTRQWGKSTVTALKAVHTAHTWPSSLILVVTPSERQSGEFLRKAAGFVKMLGERVRGDGDNEISLVLSNGSRIVGLPGREATVRGFSKVSLMLVDEAARVPDEMYKTVRPMLAVGNGDLWLMSTPFGKRGFFYEEWERGVDWVRITVPATQCPRIPAPFLEEERRTLGDRWFRQEYLCEFLAVNSSLFNEDDIRACIRDDIPPLFPERLSTC